MEQNNHLAVLAESLQVAKNDEVTNVTNLPILMANYGGDTIPVTVTFHQQRQKPIREKSGINGKRGEVIDYVNEERIKPIRFLCSNPDELRQRIGEALNELHDVLNGTKRNPFLKSTALHCTFKIAGYVISTAMIDEGGVKLRKCYHKGEFSEVNFHREFCRPLFNQLKKAEKMAKGLPLSISQGIIEAIGLNKKS
jgi:hypothetical protein